MNTKVNFTTVMEFTDEQIAEVLVGAFEGGSNYWVDKISHRPDRWDPKDACKLDRLDLPFDLWEDRSEESLKPRKHTVTREKIENGLQLMADKAKTHFANLCSDGGDAETADVFLQMVVLGEIVYG